MSIEEGEHDDSVPGPGGSERLHLEWPALLVIVFLLGVIQINLMDSITPPDMAVSFPSRLLIICICAAAHMMVGFIPSLLVHSFWKYGARVGFWLRLSGVLLYSVGFTTIA